jgi:uncharacterized repeat protein (TIGR03803 family)
MAAHGTTWFGGNVSECSGLGCGTVFKITPGGGFTMLYAFCSQLNCTDGAGTHDGVVQGLDGNFYGGTGQGGTNNGGTLYRITPGGKLTTLYSFCTARTCEAGYEPLWLTLGADGNFFGTTLSGGTNGAGAVFTLTPQGRVSVLYDFCAQASCADGATPRAGLLLGSDGNLYGTTRYGGTNLLNAGTVFKVTPAVKLTTLHSFDGTDGAYPIGSVGQATNGKLYGTTLYGGTSGSCTNGCGTIFSVDAGLGAFVQTVPASGKAGTRVVVLGTDLTGATGVGFNGVAAVYNVVSKTLISAIVPTGATTGFVTVTTPSGALKSNVKFQVRP